MTDLSMMCVDIAMTGHAAGSLYLDSVKQVATLFIGRPASAWKV